MVGVEEGGLNFRRLWDFRKPISKSGESLDEDDED